MISAAHLYRLVATGTGSPAAGGGADALAAGAEPLATGSDAGAEADGGTEAAGCEA